jgi:ribose-phosphate pyrophosphokinase
VSALTPRSAPTTSLPLSGYDKRLMLFSGRANPELAARIADKLGLGLGGVTLKTFSNGEVYCRYEESIRGADVFIVQPTCGNPNTGVNANDAVMELLEMIDAAVGASAHRVIAVMPWFGYSRQDKKSAPREPISARLVARMLEAAGADRVLTMDLHAGQVQGFFHKPVDHMTAMFILTQYFRDQQLEDIVVVSPDAGRVKLAKKFAEKVGAELAILNKERPAQQVAEIAYVIGDVKDKTAVIVDDIIDTAGTLRAAGETVKDEGARRVYAAATHAVLSGNAFENLAASPFERIVVTDTIPLRADAPDNITVLSVADPQGLAPAQPPPRATGEAREPDAQRLIEPDDGVGAVEHERAELAPVDAVDHPAVRVHDRLHEPPQLRVRRLGPAGTVDERVELHERDVQPRGQRPAQRGLAVPAGRGDDRDAPHARVTPGPVAWPAG